MEDKICQSCGMTMTKAEDFGTNADGTRSEEYCNHCYKDGSYTYDITLEEMAEMNLKYIDEWNKETGNNMTVDEARPILTEFFKTLKRWKNQ